MNLSAKSLEKSEMLNVFLKTFVSTSYCKIAFNCGRGLHETGEGKP